MSDSLRWWERATGRSPFEPMAELAGPWEELASCLDEAMCLSNSLVIALGRIGELLPPRPPTSADLIFKLQLGLVQAQSISLSAAIVLLRDFHRGVEDALEHRS